MIWSTTAPDGCTMNASVCPPPPPPPPVEMPMITGAVGSHATTANVNTSPVNRIGCIGVSFLVTLVAVSYPVLIAAELRDLLDPAQVEGLEVTWLPANKAIA